MMICTHCGNECEDIIYCDMCEEECGEACCEHCNPCCDRFDSEQLENLKIK